MIWLITVQESIEQQITDYTFSLGTLKRVSGSSSSLVAVLRQAAVVAGARWA